jgi:hypothetical protein
MKFRLMLAALAAAWVGHSVDAHAQAFLQDPRVAEGLGIKTGDWELHPGVAGEVGYDSNYFQSAGNNAVPPGREPVYDAWRLRITPSLSFTSYGRRAGLEGGGPPPTLKLHGNAALSYNMVAVNDDPTNQVAGQSHFTEAINLGLDILPGRKVGGDLSAGFVRTVEASNEADIPNAFRRNTLLGGAGVIWRPGGGLFLWRLGYDVRATFFDESAFQTMDTLRHGVTTMNRWRFLPRTQLIYRGGLHWVSYLNDPRTVGGGQSMDSQIGLNGLITNHWGMLVLGGWSSTFFESPNTNTSQNFDSLVGQAELTWYPLPQPKLLDGERPVGLSAVSMGYHRTWGISYLGEYYQSDRGYAKMVYFFAQRFVFLLTGGLSHITRPPTFFPSGALQYGGGGENRVNVTAFLEYRVSGSVGFNATYRYSSELTNVLILDAPGATTGDQLMFDRHQIYLGARWFL